MESKNDILIVECPSCHGECEVLLPDTEEAGGKRFSIEECPPVAMLALVLFSDTIFECPTCQTRFEIEGTVTLSEVRTVSLLKEEA